MSAEKIANGGAFTAIIADVLGYLPPIISTLSALIACLWMAFGLFKMLYPAKFHAFVARLSEHNRKYAPKPDKPEEGDDDE